MRAEVENRWNRFRPRTNVLWLDYLLDKLIRSVPYRCKASGAANRRSLAALKKLKARMLEYDSAEAYVRENGMLVPEQE